MVGFVDGSLDRINGYDCLQLLIGTFMNLKGKRRKLYLLLAVVVLVGGFWLWQVLNALVPQYQTLIVRP